VHNQTSKRRRRGLAFVALAGGALLAQSAFAQVPAPTPLLPPFGPAVAPGRTLQLSDMTSTNPLIPIDIYRTNNTVAHADLATFAWLSFISAVSPNAGLPLRGVPGGAFASTGTANAGPLVWETYQHRTELLPCNVTNGNNTPTPPQQWGTPPKYVVSNNPPSGTPAVCSTVTPPVTPSGIPYNNLDETTEIGQNYLFFPNNPPSSSTNPGTRNPATDGQVLFEAKVNQYESQYVSEHYQSFNISYGPFHPSPPLRLPNGTVEVKAAWRPLSLIPKDQQYRYHTATVITYKGNGDPPTPVLEQYALVALHIIHKTPNYPTFIFATFEQVDDYINQTTNNASGLYYVPTYASINYAANPATGVKPTNQLVQDPTITINGAPFNPQQPMAAPNGTPVKLPIGMVSALPGAAPIAGTNMYTVAVAAPVPTVTDVVNVNAQALALMKQLPGFNQNFVWQYYRLVGVQAIPTNDETSEDFYLANIVVESSQPGIQLFRGFPPINNTTQVLTNFRNQANVFDHSATPPSVTSGGGCQGCHGIAQTQNGFDFSFLFFGVNGNGFSPDAIGLPPPPMLKKQLVKRKYLK
jgi:hypothetical protein